QRRRIVVSAYSADGKFDHGSASVPEELKKIVLPAGYELKLEGESLAAQQATTRILQLSLVSLLLMLAVLYSRYGSLRLALIVLANVPLAMVGGIFVLAITNTPISIASLIGFVTLAGIAARNGILKVSHYLNLVLAENERFGTALILRGSSERLAPVLMTALIAALALLPLLFSADAPGKEILHPVALVIFGGLVSSTLFDSFLTPLLFHRYGAAPLLRLQQRTQSAPLY
ncbi:MAG: efflux RND transporter permease subunit, partial [Pseudomonadota bacterium]